ncbi:MAG: TonB-dependent receptor domain-containing protein [Pyrinomonadaceae bacterium]
MCKFRTASCLLLALLFSLALSGSSAHAQAVYGGISGTITDSTGAVVPNATVTVTSVERQTTDTVTTNDSGFYLKDRLLPGIYNISIEGTGFKKALLQNVTVNVDTQANGDAKLETGDVSESVEVTSEGQLLKTDRADVATTFETRQVNELPILDRNLTRLVLLTPGTQQQQWQHAASENPQGSIQTIVNGQAFSGTGYQLDGTDNRDPILGIIVINPTFESVGETKITTQNYDAEFGQAIAGVVSVQTKSGTNEIHGSLFEFRQNDVLQARNPFSQSSPDAVTGKLVPDTLRNQFGGSIGGPIIKNRFFYFGDYQGTRSKVGGSRLLTLPTAAARNGDFSGYLRFNPDNSIRSGQIFDPATTRTVNGQVVRDPFPGNIIPAARLSPQARNLLRLIPLPNLPGREGGTRDNFASSGSELFDNDLFNVRLDGRINDRLNAFGRYSFADFTRDGPTALGQGGGAELVTLGGTSSARNQSLALGFDYLLSNTAVLDVRFGFFKYFVNVLPFDYLTTPSTDAGIPGLNFDELSSGLFGGFIEGDFGFNIGSGLGVNRSNSPLTQDERQYQIVANLSKNVGNHNLKFGVDFRRANNLRLPSDRHRAGELNFSPDRTGLTGVNNSGLGIATFLLGDVTGFGRYISPPNLDARERQFRQFYYGQDTWRVTPKLTVAYGVRLDVINPQKLNEPGNGGFFDPSTGQIRVAGIGDTDLAGNVENSLNFAPRLGISYQLNDRTVIRGGYGRSYDIGVFGSVFGHSVTQNLPVLAVQQLNRSGPLERVFTLAQGAPAFTQFFGLNAPPNRGGTPNATLPANGTFFLPDGVFSRALPDKQRLPTVDAYNVTLQYQLTPTISLEAAYVGNKGTHVFAGDGPAININQPTLAGYTENRNTNLARPLFQQFGLSQDIDFFCNCADNRYNALQVKADKRFSDSYSLLAHYTYQRAENNSAEQFFYDRELNRGPADFDRTHNFVLTNLIELPFGRGKRFGGDASRLLDFFIGGFQFNSATILQSGQPFNVGISTNGISDTGPNRPDLVGEISTGGSREQFFNPGVFARPAVGTFGNLGRNALRGPGFFNTDASLFKRFNIDEVRQIEFRIEVTNLFNKVNLGQPEGFIGNPASPNLNAGRINSTFGPQRNFQFAAKFKF